MARTLLPPRRDLLAPGRLGRFQDFLKYPFDIYHGVVPPSLRSSASSEPSITYVDAASGSMSEIPLFDIPDPQPDCRSAVFPLKTSQWAIACAVKCSSSSSPWQNRLIRSAAITAGARTEVPHRRHSAKGESSHASPSMNLACTSLVSASIAWVSSLFRYKSVLMSSVFASVCD